MTTKVELRGRNQEAYQRWTANRDDSITAHGLDSLLANAKMPTLDTVKERYPDLSLAKQQEMLGRALQQYQDENTALYFLVKESVIISGPYEALDREYIKDQVCWAERCTESARRPRLPSVGRLVLRRHQGRCTDQHQERLCGKNEIVAGRCVARVHGEVLARRPAGLENDQR